MSTVLDYDWMTTAVSGFFIPFVVDMDLTSMSAVRLGVRRPRGEPPVLRDLSGWQALEGGDTLNVEVLDGDFTVKGAYVFQVYARRMNGELVEVSTNSQEVVLKVKDPAVINPWQ